MHTRSAAICAAVLAGTMLAIPAAWADDLEIDPGTVRPGDTITVSGGCRDNDSFVSVSGPASGRGAVSTGYFSIQAKVKQVEPGRYTVISKCVPSGYPQTGRISIERHKSRDRDHKPPDGWVRTGGGGTQGPGVPWTGLGLAMVAGAVGICGVALLRSRARGRE
ncbi:hypothetical protein [Actinomadura rudentiformis]|uniref:Sortase n=1 Tax=Actinomadura rudentiformis TaxID=359158 RepID=A0A6H9Z8J6_9ACTN|nr:hypothetical protein [Actinomadura rudentiformis]KAB2352646.1 hypothetical protein F8566_03095 [Actinomadura rudentiformis]